MTCGNADRVGTHPSWHRLALTLGVERYPRVTPYIRGGAEREWVFLLVKAWGYLDRFHPLGREPRPAPLGG